MRPWGWCILVRHGQASFGAADYDVLSETGWEQGRLLGRWLRERGVAPTAVLRGGMRRHRETAEAIQQGAAGWPAAVEDLGWDEFDHLGRGRGRPRTSPTGELDRRGFQRAFELATARWTGGGFDTEYAESWPGFVDRVRAAAGPGLRPGRVRRDRRRGHLRRPDRGACAALADPDADAASYRATVEPLQHHDRELVVHPGGGRLDRRRGC